VSRHTGSRRPGDPTPFVSSHSGFFTDRREGARDTWPLIPIPFRGVTLLRSWGSRDPSSASVTAETGTRHPETRLERSPSLSGSETSPARSGRAPSLQAPAAGRAGVCPPSGRRFRPLTPARPVASQSRTRCKHIPPSSALALKRLPKKTHPRSRYQPDGKPQSPGVISSTELPAGSRK
jgi:hypothetical protein